LKKLLRPTLPDPRQLVLQLDFFHAAPVVTPRVDQPAPRPAPPIQAPLAPTLPLAGDKRRIVLDDQPLDYTLRRSKRRSIGFLIEDDGLRITAPKWVTLGEIESAIREKQRWIFTKLMEQRERAARRLQPDMKWQDGATLPYLGQNVTLRIEPAQTASIRYDEQKLELTVCLQADASEQQLKDRVLCWLQSEAIRLFAERLPLYAEKLGVHYASFTLSSAKTQWGSCTADGRIRLNWRLMHFPLQQIDYVIAHELAHLREMNHSPRFWSTVQSVFPEFKTARKALRDHAPETLPSF
jgi:predicted metal-dependent hydrolase